VNLPIVVRTENIRKMFTSENASARFRPRHLDTSYNFVREFIGDGFIKIELVRSAESESDYLPITIVRSYVKNKRRNFSGINGEYSTGCLSKERKGVGDILYCQLFSFTHFG
jgi:hypothetical protein